MKIARVFPRRTKATPVDDLAFIGDPPKNIPEIDEVRISVAFTYDIPKAELLAEKWLKRGLSARMGGPAFDETGGAFIPGMYLKDGYVITSRGCLNKCWFCRVWKREGTLRELEIKNGWNVLDDNLLACSDDHVKAVFEMLKQQDRQPEFTGGLEAKILKPWHAEKLREIKTKRMYFAYDTTDDYEPLVNAGKLLQNAGFTVASHVMCCYVLIGYPGDTFFGAEQRLIDTVKAGFMPYAMLYKDEDGKVSTEWSKYQREWVRPQIVASKMSKILKGGELKK
jgi:hypothetical protein